MALIKKTLFPENLDKYTTFINDTDINSKYFKITELPDTFTGGKNAFLIAGSSELVADTVVKVEIKDAAGNIIYYEPGEGRMYSEINGEQFISEYYEGVSKVVAVYIYPDTTAYGPCTITILGELSSYYDSDGLLSTIPLDWQGTYNVKWQKTVNVNPTLPNTTKIRFYKRPTVTINEILSPIYQIDSEAGLKINTGINQSFADIRISNLETFAGDVKRVKVFRTSTGDISDYDMIQDILVESKELLITYDLSSSVIGNTGTFTSETLKQYWNTGSLQATLTTDKVESGLKLNGSGNLRYSSSLQLKSTNTYEINLDAFYSSSTDSNIGIYLSGSDGGDVLVGSLNGISPTKNLLDTTIPFKLDSDFASASLYFSQSNGEWHLGNISLKLSEDTAFSPDAISFITSMPNVVSNQDFNFKFEFYDVNSNYVPVLVTGSASFVGGSTAITKLLTFESDRTAFRFSTGSYANPPSQFVKFKTTRTNFTGSVVYSSASFDTNGNYIEPSSYAGAYPGAFQIQNDNEALLSVANFTGSINTVLVGTITFTASCEGFEEYETIYRFEDGDNAPGLFVTSNANQFIYKATDLSLNPAGQIITIEAKRKNLASATTPLTVNSGSGKPPLTFVSTNATNGVDTYTLAGTTYPYGTGETRYFISGSDQFGNEFSDTIKITPVKILDGLSATLTNDNASLPALSTGFVASGSFIFTSGSVNVKVGNETIVFDDDNDGNRANNTFAITNLSGIGCTPNVSNPSTNGYGITNLSDDSGSLDITISYKDGAGDTTSIIKTATYTKNKKAAPVLEFVIGNNNQSVTAKSTGEQIDAFVNATFTVNESYNGVTTQKTFTPTSITATNSYSVGNANATSLILPSMANGTNSVDISVTGTVVDSENVTRFVYGSISLSKVQKAAPTVDVSASPQTQVVLGTNGTGYTGIQYRYLAQTFQEENCQLTGGQSYNVWSYQDVGAGYYVINALNGELIGVGNWYLTPSSHEDYTTKIDIITPFGCGTQTTTTTQSPVITQLETAVLQDVVISALEGEVDRFVSAAVTSSVGLTDTPLIEGNIIKMSDTRIAVSDARVSVNVTYTDSEGTTRNQLIIIRASTSLTIELQEVGELIEYNVSSAFKIANLNSATASLYRATASLNAATASFSSSIGWLNIATASLNQYTQSQDSKNLTLSSVTASLNQYTQSQDSKNLVLSSVTASLYLSTASLNSATASLYRATASLNQYTQSQDSKNLVLSSVTASFSSSIGSLNTATASFSSSIGSLNTTTASFSSSIGRLNSATASLNLATASFSSSIGSLNTATASLNLATASFSSSIGSLNSKTGSYATTGSNIFTGNQTITGSLFITQNLIVQGSSSIQNISSSTLNIGTNIITVAVNQPAVRFGGLAVIDSGSAGGSGSFLYDSMQDEFIFVHRGNGTNVTSSHFVLGPETYDNLGNEIYLTNNILPKGTGKEHIVDSQIFDNGSRVGIGQTNPLLSLDVSNISGNTYGRPSIGGRSADGTLWGYMLAPINGGTFFDFVRSNNLGLRFATESSLGSGTFSTQMFISSGGNVGIGTTSPTLGRVHVNGGNIGIEHSSGQGLVLYNNSDENRAGYISITGDGDFSNRFVNIGSTSTAYGFKFINGAGTHITVLNNGNVGIGTPTPTAKLEVNGTGFFSNSVTISSAGYVQLLIDQTDSAAVAHGITSASARAFVNVSNDGVGHVTGTSAYAFLFNGVERARLTSDGSLGIGTTSLTGINFRSSKPITGSASGFGILQDGTIGSDITTSASLIQANVSQVAGVTTPNVYTFIANQGTVSGSITNLHGFYVNSNMVSATNSYGFRGLIPNASNRWNLYMDGTAPNYMAGSLGIGTINPASQLHISGEAPIQTITATNVSSGLRLNITGQTGGYAHRIQRDGVTIQATSVTGNVGIGNDFTAGANLLISKNIEGSIAPSAIAVTGIVQSGVTQDTRIFQSSPNVVAGHTLPNLYHFIVSPATTYTGTVTTQTGVYIQSNLTGATNNYGLRSLIPAVSGANHWNLFMDGTAPNHMAGSLGIGTTTLTERSLGISKPITGASTAYGVFQTGQIQSDVTVESFGFRNLLNTAAASFNLGNYFHYAATSIAFGTGSTIGGQTGFFANASLTGATNNFGFRGLIPAGTGRWNLYMDGTANNYMAGSLGIGTLGLTGLNFRNSKTITGGGSGFSYGNYSDGQIQNDVTGAAWYYRTQASTQATSFTLPSLLHYHAAQGTIGAGSDVTTQTGFLADATLIGGTTNIGFNGAIPAAANRWNVYMSGTAQNYFNGSVGIGVTVPVTKLDVRGQVSADLGTLTNPAYSFVGDLNTGLYSPSADALALVTNGANRIHVDNVGNVGIGVMAPTQKLEIHGGNDVGISIFNTNSNYWDITNGLNGTLNFIRGRSNNFMQINQFGNVGIGTVAPTERLHISGSILQTGFNTGLAYADATGKLILATAANVNTLLGNDSLTTNYVPKWNGTAFTNSQIFDNGTNVGVGTTSPIQSIHLRKESAVAVSASSITGSTLAGTLISNLDISANIGASIAFQLGGTGTAWASIAATRPSANNSHLSFYTELDDVFSEKVRILNNGNVGIGTETPTRALQIQNSGSNLFSVQRTGYDAWGFLQSVGTGIHFHNYTDSRTDMYIDGSGNIGMGTTIPATKLHIQAGNANQLRLDNSGERYTEIDYYNSGSLRAATYYDNTANEFVQRTLTTASIGFDTNLIRRMTISSSGNVGIGTATPTQLLHVNGNTRLGERIEMQPSRRIGAGLDFGNVAEAGSGYLELYNSGTGDTSLVNTTNFASITLHTNNTERLRVLHNGNVGIGITTPSQSLHVFTATPYQIQVQRSGVASALIGVSAQTANSTGDLLFEATQASQGFVFRSRDSGSALINSLGIDRNGNVGIGIFNPTTKLDVRGQVSANIGTLANPAYSFVGDLNTGLYSPSADTLALVTNGVNRLNVSNVGDVLIGSAAGVNSLMVSKNITGGADVSGIRSSGQIQSDVTGSAFLFRAIVNQASASLSTLVVYESNAGTISGTGTNFINYRAAATSAGFTNVYGFQGTISSGTSRWNLYMDGTANNYMAGSLGIGTTALAGYNLYVNKNITGAVISYGIRSDGQVQSDVTSQARYFQTLASVAANTSALPLLTHYNTAQGTFTGNVTTQAGFLSDASLIGATNNYGFRGSIPAGTGRWNTFNDGTAQNHFRGNVGIGVDSTIPLTALDVRGQVSANLGSLTNPAYSFVGDLNTGLYSPSADALALVTNGVNRIHVNNVGNVGIETATPSSTSKLHVNNVVGFSVRFQNTYFSNTVESNTNFARGGIFNNAEYIDEGGATKIWKIRAIGANDAAGILFGNSGTLNFISVPNVENVDRSLTHAQLLSNARMTILASGFVGINTTTPATILDVRGQVSADLGTLANPAYSFVGDLNTGLYSPSADTLALVTNGVARVTISNVGFMSVAGSGSFTGDITVNQTTIGRGGGNISGNTVVGQSAGFNNTTGNQNSFFGFTAGITNTTGQRNSFFGLNSGYFNVTGSNNAFFGTESGLSNVGSNNICIGASAGASLTGGNDNTIIGRIVGTAGLSGTIIIGAGTTERIRVSSAGVMSVAGSATFTGDVTANTSDKRLKDNIRVIDNPLEKLSKINGVYFNWNDAAKDLIHKSDDIEEVGFLAQEVQSVLPHIVKPAPFDIDVLTGESKSGENYLTIQYEKIVPLLVEAIKELKKQVDELKNK